jgi:hypothetical protein
MRDRRRLGVTVFVIAIAACGGSSAPTAPTPPVVPNPAPSGGTSNVTGITVDALSDQALAGIAVRIDGVGNATTGEDGRFGLTATGPEQLRSVTVVSASTVERSTHLRAPGPEARLTLMPSTLDLAAFNQMFRSSGQLQRWTSAPRIVVQSRVLQFTNVTDLEYVATSQVMTDAEVTALLADLTFGLPQLTGNNFTAFSAETRETAAAGERVAVSRPGAIVVARYDGLTAGTAPQGYWGYGRWQTSAGEVRSGILMIDNGFDTSGSQFRRSLRVHELGHALGYNHVSVRDSVMNSHARFEPNAFDRDGSRFAFLRPPQNRSPDIDPDPFSLNLRIPATPVWNGAR